MHFDGTVTLGNIIATISIIGGMWAALMRVYGFVDRRLDAFQAAIVEHTLILKTHAVRMDRQEEGLTKLTNDFLAKNERQTESLTRLTGDIQRVVGRMEAWKPGS